ncbi:MAG: SAM-dependent chlorinase/fluorinase [Cryomorphaceae bacterium]|nr:SAM-dependent chlorinase/fluorinase [Cryomorphaceae bacterium]
MNIITLTSDYGLKDPYTAIWKASIFSQNPNVQLVDISHSIAPANFAEAAYIIGSAYRYFPKGTVHIIAIEEMDAHSMRFIAGEKDGHFFVAPDNGILSLIRPEFQYNPLHIIEIDATQSDFPATEIMTKAALFLAENGKISLLGKPCTDVQSKVPWRPIFTEQNKSLTAHVIYIDRRGNLVTNLPQALFEKHRKEGDFTIHLPAGTRISKITKSFREIRQEASIFAMFNHNQLLEIGVYGGSLKNHTGASHLLGLTLQNKIIIEFS